MGWKSNGGGGGKQQRPPPAAENVKGKPPAGVAGSTEAGRPKASPSPHVAPPAPNEGPEDLQAALRRWESILSAASEPEMAHIKEEAGSQIKAIKGKLLASKSLLAQLQSLDSNVLKLNKDLSVKRAAKTMLQERILFLVVTVG
ncbi:MAG: hypothetical protein ACKPKO_29845 [Candidatus Fonsibacter sp.]